MVEVRVLPSRGSNHIKVTGDEAVMLMCGRKADRVMLLSGWLARQAQGGRYHSLMHGRYKFNKKLSRLLHFFQRMMEGMNRYLVEDELKPQQ